MKYVVVAMLLCVFVGASTAPQARASDNGNPIGMNTGGVSNWDISKPMVDLIKLANPWERPAGGKARIDAQGWPLEDAETVVWTALAHMNGTYKLSFTGQADAFLDWGSGHIANQVYNLSTNTTTADVVADSADTSNMILGFRNSNGGVKNVKLIRPGYGGNETFTTPYKNALAKGAVIRLLDFTNADASRETNWSDRRLPSYFSQSASEDDAAQAGAAWEYAIQLCNELHRDAWINIPTSASDDYVAQLAQLWRNGDTVDGVTYAALDPGLNLYVEFSNEVWNPTFESWRQNHAAAIAEGRAGSSPLNYDGVNDDTLWAWRRTGKRIKEISDVFRSVFGDAAMGTRVRPVLAAQLGTIDVGKEALTFIDNVYGGQHPVSYYLYGYGGSAYYSPNNDSDSLTLDSLFGSLLTDDWVHQVQLDTDWATTYGLWHVAYEGGPTLDTTGHSDGVKAAAVHDPRMTQAMVDQHNAWTTNGGGLLVYFVVAWDYQWGFTDNIDNLDTPKNRALDQLASSPPAALTYGMPVPAKLNAGRWSITSGSSTPGDGPITLRNPSDWTAYTLRADSAGPYQVSLTYFSDQAGDLQIWLDGAQLSRMSLARTGGADQTTAPISTTLDAGLHSIRLRSLSGQFNVRTLNVDAAPQPTATPTPMPSAMPTDTVAHTPEATAEAVPMPAPDDASMPAADDGTARMPDGQAADMPAAHVRVCEESTTEQLCNGGPASTWLPHWLS